MAIGRLGNTDGKEAIPREGERRIVQWLGGEWAVGHALIAESVPPSFRAVLAAQNFNGMIAYASFTNPCIEACGMERIEKLHARIEALVPAVPAAPFFRRSRRRDEIVGLVTRSFRICESARRDGPRQHIQLIDELFVEIDRWLAEGMKRPKRLKMAKPAALAMAEASLIPLD